MKYYIFRNSTLEIFFKEFDVVYSDYGDVLNFDKKFDRYMFFYILSKRDLVIFFTFF